MKTYWDNEPTGDFVERRIRTAICAGVFDDLPGRGKPLQFDRQANVSQDLRLAFRVLKNAGIAPARLEMQKGVREEIELARKTLKRGLEAEHSEAERLAVERFKADCERINNSIRRINLGTPAVSLQLKCLDFELELARATPEGK